MAKRPRRPSNTAKAASNDASSATRPSMFRFVSSFLLIGVGLFVIYWLSEWFHLFQHVNRLNAFLSSVALNAIGFENTRNGTTVLLSGGGMEVISECSGVYVEILFASGVLAFPTSWSARWRGLWIGSLVIFVINLIRLVTLGAIIAYRAELLPFFHEYLWQVLFILVVAVLYLVWIERMVPREPVDAIS